MSACMVIGCTADGSPRDRYVAHPIGSFSIAGQQAKVTATQVVTCDEHWELIAEREAGNE